jgi:DNA-binding NtrC family response regulator
MNDEIQVEGEELPHLLLVDDDATFTRVMARAMARRGFRVSTAGSAEEGLSMAKADLPDYAALDLKMDGDSGLVLLPKLLEMDPEMRVVILTGYSSIATAVEAIKRGACNYLCKPGRCRRRAGRAAVGTRRPRQPGAGKPDVRGPFAVGTHSARIDRTRRQHLRHGPRPGHAPPYAAAQTAEASRASLNQR